MSNWLYPSYGLDNGLALNRRQAIIWTNASPIQWRIYAALKGDNLIRKCKPLPFCSVLVYAYGDGTTIINCRHFANDICICRQKFLVSWSNFQIFFYMLLVLSKSGILFVYDVLPYSNDPQLIRFIYNLFDLAGNCRVAFYQYGLILTSAWMIKHISYT